MSPEELARFQDLKNKIKRAKGQDGMSTPQRSFLSPEMDTSNMANQKSIIKTPDDKSKRLTRKVTYAPLPPQPNPSDSMMLPGNSMQSPGYHKPGST